MSALPETTEHFRCVQYFSTYRRRHEVRWDYTDREGQYHYGTARTPREAERKAAKFGYAKPGEAIRGV